jgi:hypothetical protein
MRRKLASLLAAAGIALGIGLTTSPSAAFWARGVDWGAIYYDHRTGNGTHVWGYNTEAEARRAAQREAQRRGIRPTVWFTAEGMCISVYKARGSTRYGWARRGDHGPAAAAARRICQQGGHVCDERVWVCTSR